MAETVNNIETFDIVLDTPLSDIELNIGEVVQVESEGSVQPVQEKSVDITENGSVAVTPDSGYLLSKVNVNVNVASSGEENKNNAFIDLSTYSNGGYIYSFISSIDISAFDTSKVTSMNSMFSSLFGIKSLDLRSLDTSNVTNMGNMFSSCSNLQSLDVSSFKTSKVTDMKNMFSGCYNLAPLDVSSFDTSQVTTMSGMFDSCSKLTSLDLSSFNTSKVTNFSYMFYSCSNLASLDLSSFDTSNVTNMGNMLNYCRNLETLILGNNWASNASITSFYLQPCRVLSHDSLVDIMNKLAPRTNNPTLQLSSDSKNLLTDDEKAIATGKGWTIA